LQDATTDAAVIRRWWSKWPTANVAIRTGVVSGLLVLDLDAKHGDPDAMIGVLELLADGDCPQTTVSLTGGGGRHLLFALDPDGETAANSSGRLGAGIDVRGENGYIVAPPSLHQSGSRYAWADYAEEEWQPCIEPASADWLLRAIAAAAKAHASPAPSSRGSDGPRQYLAEVPDWMSSALAALSPDCGYQDWIAVGMALEQCPGGFEMWDAWSRRAPHRYGGDEAMARAWRGIQGRVSKLRVGTIWQMATQAGWTPPAVKREVVPPPDDRHAPGSRRAASSPPRALRVVNDSYAGFMEARSSAPPPEPPPGFDEIPMPWEDGPVTDAEAESTDAVKRLDEWVATLHGMGTDGIAAEVTTGWAPRTLARMSQQDPASYLRVMLLVSSRLTGAQLKALKASVKAFSQELPEPAAPSLKRDESGHLFGTYFVQPGREGRPPEVVRIKSSEDGDKTFTVCQPPVHVTGVTMDIDTGEHFTSLGWQVGGRAYTLDLPQDQTHTARMITGAAKHGLPVSSSTASEMVDYLVEAEIEHVARHGATLTTRRTGWHGRSFLRGQHVHAADGESAPSLRVMDREHKVFFDAFAESGSLTGWVKAMRPALLQCEPLRMYVAAAVAPPLLSILGTLVEPFVVDMVSTTSQGKTTALRVAASAWGVPHALQREWNTTWVALDRLAGMCNGLPLLLNESQLGPRQNPQLYAQMVYGLTSRVGKARGSVTGLARQERYESITLSNGESSLAEMTGDGGLKARCLTYWGSPWGGTTDAHRLLALQTREGAEANHGHAARAVCDYLVRCSDTERTQLRELWRSLCHEVTEKSRGMYPDHAVAPRLATYVATCEVAGWVLSHTTGVMPEATRWVTDATLRRCLERSASADRASAALEELLAWIGSNPEEWAAIGSNTAQTPPRGWVGALRRTSGEFDGLHVMPNRLTDYLEPRGFSVNAMLSTWHERGWIVSEASRGGRRFTVKRPIAGQSTRCVSFTAEGLSKLNGLLGSEGSHLSLTSREEQTDWEVG
jgi:hypothetical protein